MAKEELGGTHHQKGSGQSIDGHQFSSDDSRVHRKRAQNQNYGGLVSIKQRKTTPVD